MNPREKGRPLRLRVLPPRARAYRKSRNTAEGEEQMERAEGRQGQTAGTQQTAQPQEEHRLVLNGRRQLTASGVKEVTSYDAYAVTLETACGTLVIGGSGLRVRSFSAESGEARMEGSFEYLQYQNAAKGEKQEGLLRRLLR